MYQIATETEILYQGFDKYAAHEVWEAVQGGDLAASLFFNGDMIDFFCPLSLAIEDPFDVVDTDLDDLEGFEFL